MLRSSALFYALLISLLIGSVSTSLILYSLHHRQEVTSYLEQERAVINARSGVHYGLGVPALPYGKEQEFQVSDNGLFTLRKEPWGAFEVLHVKGVSGGSRSSRTAMIGRNRKDGEQVGLYLADHGNPLSICGRTRLAGNCYLPRAGVERAYIEGKNYLGDEMVYGEQRKSQRDLPDLDEDLLRVIGKGFRGSSTSKDTVMNFSDVGRDTLHRSFSEPTLVILAEKDAQLAGIHWSGNIALKCEGGVRIGSSCSLDGILVHATRIRVDRGFQGNFQGFAREWIEVEEDVRLGYPSVLAVLHDRIPEEGSSLRLAKRSIIEGVVFVHGENEGGTRKPRVTIEEDGEVEGQLYVDGELELNGSILGSAYCKKTYLKTPSSIYTGHLLDAVIDPQQRSEFFVGTSLIEEEHRKAVIQWR